MSIRRYGVNKSANVQIRKVGNDMQVLININDEDYNDITLTGENTINLGVLLQLRKAVRNGIALPRGYGRLLDENEIKKEAIRCEWSRQTYDMLDHMLSYMKPVVVADRSEES